MSPPRHGDGALRHGEPRKNAAAAKLQVRPEGAPTATVRQTAHLHTGRDGGAGCIAACGYVWDGPTDVADASADTHRFCASCLEHLVYGGGARCSHAHRLAS